MPYWLFDIIFPLVRWVHIVCMTLIVGGTLFFELVLPVAVEDLQREEKLYLFARARLVFRWVVWISVTGLLISGALSLWRMWHVYQDVEVAYVFRWVLGHIAVGIVAMVIAMMLTVGRRPPEDPVRWMRLNLIILLVTIFMGSATRHFQLALFERGTLPGKQPPEETPRITDGSEEPATQPATTAPAPR